MIDNDTRPLCKHCKERPVWVRHKGYCFKCYPKFKAMCTPCEDCSAEIGHPLHKNEEDADISLPLIRPLPTPTDALPGTERKVQVLIHRRERGEELWHPKDAGMAGWKELLKTLDLDISPDCLTSKQ